MLLERMYTKEEIKDVFRSYELKARWDSEFASEVQETEEIIYKKLRFNHENLDEDELRQIIHFSTINWDIIDSIDAKNADFCDRCGYCCKECSPLFILPEEFDYYSDKTLFDNNLTICGTGYKFLEDTPCKYHDDTDKKCDIYEIRPTTCRNYPISAEGLHISPKCNNVIQIIINKTEELIADCQG